MSSAWATGQHPTNGTPTPGVPSVGVPPGSGGGSNIIMPPPSAMSEQNSPQSESEDCDELGNDAEGVWSPDIEQSFQEALAIYPPCGRRKIILSDEGKMYGRNELIARYIKLRTGKTRTRKQVSSHIQVLARRKSKEIQAQIKDHSARDRALQSMAGMSSAQIVSATAMHNKMSASMPNIVAPQQAPPPTHPVGAGIKAPASPNSFWQAGSIGHDIKPHYASVPGYEMCKPESSVPPSWQGRTIAGPKLRMVEFSSYVEQHREPEAYHKHLFVHIDSSPIYGEPLLESIDLRQISDKFPESKGGLKDLYDKGPQTAFFLVKFWADLNMLLQDDASTFYGVNAIYEGFDTSYAITVYTKVCSFGKQVVEKVETEYPRSEGGRSVYRIQKSPMCEYMINFITKLRSLPERFMMNSVLENFTILQVVTNRDTNETLLCIAFVFEVSTSEHGTQHHIYRLVKD